MSDDRKKQIDGLVELAAASYAKCLRPIFEGVFQAIDMVESSPLEYRVAALVLLTDLRKTVLEKSARGDIPGIEAALAEHLRKFQSMLGN